MQEAKQLTPESPFKKDTVAVSQNRNIPNCYWRKEDGWIVVGAGPDTAQGKRWKDGGREPLVSLSITDRFSPKTNLPERIEYAEDKLATEPYYWLFQNGGAKEFTIQQIVEHHWHITPPYGLSTDVFPQLKEWDVPDPLWCHVCPAGKPPFNSIPQIIQHGQIAHKMSRPEVQSLLETAKEKPLGTGGLAPVLRRKDESPKAKAERKAFAKEAVKEAGDATKSNLNVCHACGNEIEGKLAEHQC